MRHVQRSAGVIGVFACICGTASAVSPFFYEDFNTPDSTTSWGGGVTGATYSNPGTGGVGGDGDGYFLTTRSTPGSLGARSLSLDYVGDYIAAGVTSISFWLRDVGATQNMNISFSIGNSVDIYQWNTLWQPPTDGWAEYTVDLTDESMWTSFGFGTGSFEDALRNADRLLIRHSTNPPPMTGSQPPPIAGQLGLDRISFVPAPGAAALMLGGLGLAGARRRR